MLSAWSRRGGVGTTCVRVCVHTHLETKVRLAEEQVGESGTPWQADYRGSRRQTEESGCEKEWGTSQRRGDPGQTGGGKAGSKVSVHGEWTQG